MIVQERHVAQAVGEVSAGAEDPSHVASLVGALMQRQPAIGQYASAHANELSLEGVVLTLLHAAVVERCVEIGRGRSGPPLGFVDLDAASATTLEVLRTDEPLLVAYLEGNIAADDATLAGPRRATALGLLAIIARALLDQA